MGDSSNYVSVSVSDEARREARIVKAKREQSWSGFLADAAKELDPDSTD